MQEINIKTREVKQSAKYYTANKEGLREDARSKYKSLSEKEKEKKRKNQINRYHMNIDLNKRLKQYQRLYHTSEKIKKIKTLIF